MTKQAFKYLAKLGIQKIIGFALYFIGTGFTVTYAGAIYFIYLFAATVILGVILFKANKETLAERNKINTDSPVWDKVLLFVFWILNYFVVYLLAGRGENGEHLNWMYFTGIGLTMLAAWISTRATLENTFLESTARIQSDRNQTVCTTGPYKMVRHPAYSALILNCVGVCMIFPYVGVWVCMAVTVIVIIVRTALEDKMLRIGLEGYTEYAKQTKYRLVPFIW